MRFWEMATGLKALLSGTLSQSAFPKAQAPIPQKQLDFVFGDCFWGLMQDVPTGEDYQHEEEELQGKMREAGAGQVR